MTVCITRHGMFCVCAPRRARCSVPLWTLHEASAQYATYRDARVATDERVLLLREGEGDHGGGR